MAQKTASNNSAQPRRPGRPPKGDPATDNARLAIVEAAAREFSRDGYNATSMRAIARSAGVDPALVRHYFTHKADLFSESIAAPIRADRVLTAALEGPLDQIGENVVRYIVETLDNPDRSAPVVRMLHAALDQEFAAAIVNELLIGAVLRPMAEKFGERDSELRASFAATQLVGLVLARYGTRIEPLASASPDEVVRRVAPVVQWHLTGASVIV